MKSNKCILFILLFSIILVSGCAQKQANEFGRDFAGQELHFRANLTEAALVPIEPDENYVKGIFFNSNTNKIQIAYIPNDAENGFYAVSGYELAYKLIIINKYYFSGTIVPIETAPVNTTEEAYGLYEPNAMVVLMLGPSHANETSVAVKNNIIIVSGADFSETDRKYTDLDLAVDKLLLVLMEAEKV